MRPTKKVFDNSKVSDHNAIIPTGAEPRRIWTKRSRRFLIWSPRRFIAVFYPAAQFEVTTRLTRVEGEVFKTDGRVIKDPGWMAVYGREATLGDGSECRSGRNHYPGRSGSCRRDRSPRERDEAARALQRGYLLATMEGAGKLVEDEELRAAMSAKGLGTARHARRDYRGPHSRRLHCPSGTRALRPREGHLSDRTLARHRHPPRYARRS